MILRDKKIIFVHIPKTAGDSIESALSVPSDEYVKHGYDEERLVGLGPRGWAQHYSTDVIQEIVGVETYMKCYKFTVVRNPWDRFVSSFHYEQQFFGEMDFDQYVQFPKFANPQHRLAQTTYIIRPVDYTIRFEELQQGWNHVCERIGLDSTALPHTNKSTRKHYTEYYNDETRKIIADRYHLDIKRYNYKFGE